MTAALMDPHDRGLLVLGYPRSGFTLLISVISELLPLAHRHPPGPWRQVLRSFCDTAGQQISRRIEQVFQRHGRSADMLYNPNFRLLAGGPKWLKQDDPAQACFRKYIGIRGGGDFTLITSHPREVLAYHDIAHSHVGPALWPAQEDYATYRRFASVRNPAGTITSACFSLNALASEYIQRFVPPEQDNDEIRQRLGMNKLSDMNFFEALLGPYRAYMQEFLNARQHYSLMRWEDLITAPAATIRAVGRAMDIDLDEDAAAAIWRKLDHVNLTGAHKHNLRVGHGVVGGWRRWLTNAHIDLLRSSGFDDYARQFGYEPLQSIDESEYTPFQRQLQDLMRRGQVFRDYGDEDLYGYAFNKTNIDISRFAFKRYPWRRHTQIERSSSHHDDIVMAVSEAAEEACGTFNEGLRGWLALDPEERLGDAALTGLAESARPLYDDADQWQPCRAALLAHRSAPGTTMIAIPAAPIADPVLLRTVGHTNIVGYAGWYYALPQAIGPIDLRTESAEGRPGVRKSENLDWLIAEVGAG